MQTDLLESSLKEIADLKAALDEHAIVAFTDSQGKITSVNDKFCAISKYSREELIGKDHRIINSGHHPKEFFRNLWLTISNGRVWHGDIKNKAKDGSFYWVATTIVPFLNEDGKPRQYIAIRADITERKQGEEAAARLVAIVRSSDDAIISKTLDGIVTSWNAGAEQIFGYRAEEMIGQSIMRLIPVERRHEEVEILTRVRRGEGIRHFDTVRLRKDGSKVDVSIATSPIKDARGEIIGVSKVARDITERRKTELALREAHSTLEHRVVERTAQLEAANKELEAFSYSVAHDLRAPLRHIDGYSKLLAEQLGASLDNDAGHYLESIQDSTRSMGEMVDDLLNLSRVARKELNLQVSGLSSLVEEVVKDLKPEVKDREIEWKIADLPFVECDPALVKQVFVNLLSNAVKFTRTRTHAVIEVGQKTIDGETVIYVRDNGVGFSMKYSDKLFGVFQRLHRQEDFEGTGVGLATVQRIVQKHGGRIWAQAELNTGATFYFTLGTNGPAPGTDGGSL